MEMNEFSFFKIIVRVYICLDAIGHHQVQKAYLLLKMLQPGRFLIYILLTI